MKSLFVCILGLLVATGADAATGRGRKSMAGQMMDESRAVVSKNQKRKRRQSHEKYMRNWVLEYRKNS